VVTNEDGTLALQSSLTYVPTADDIGKSVYCEIEHPKTLKSKVLDQLSLNVFRKYLKEFYTHKKATMLSC